MEDKKGKKMKRKGRGMIVRDEGCGCSAEQELLLSKGGGGGNKTLYFRNQKSTGVELMTARSPPSNQYRASVLV